MELAGGSADPKLGVWVVGSRPRAVVRPSGTTPVPLTPPCCPSLVSTAELSALEKALHRVKPLDLLGRNKANKVHSEEAGNAFA